MKGLWYNHATGGICKDWVTKYIKRWKEIALPKECEK